MHCEGFMMTKKQRCMQTANHNRKKKVTQLRSRRSIIFSSTLTPQRFICNQQDARGSAAPFT